MTVPVGLLAARLDLDLWYDEACTIQLYVSRGFREIVTRYPDANNHVLFSLILRPFWLLSDADPVLRLPSFLFAIGTLLGVHRILRRLAGPQAAALGVLWLGLNQMFLIHTIQVRGYGLSMCLAAWLTDWATRDDRPRRATSHLAAVLAMAGFLYAVPSNALFHPALAIIALIRAARRPRPRAELGREFGTWAAGAALAVAAYAPILSDVLTVARSPGVWTDGPLAFARLIRAATFDAPWLWAMLPLGLIAPRIAPRARTVRTPPILPAAVLLGLFGPLALQTALQINVPYDRTFCPALVFLAAGAGWLSWEFADAVRRAVRPSASRAGAAALALLLVAAVHGPPLLTYSRRLADVRDRHFAQDGYWCYYAAGFHPSRIVDVLRRYLAPHEPYLVAADRQGYFSLDHYLHRAGLGSARAPADGSPCRAKVFYVVPALSNLNDVAQRSRLSVDSLRRFPQIADLGYFRVFAAEKTIRLGRAAPPE